MVAGFRGHLIFSLCHTVVLVFKMVQASGGANDVLSDYLKFPQKMLSEIYEGGLKSKFCLHKLDIHHKYSPSICLSGRCDRSHLPTWHGATNPDPARPQVVDRGRCLDIEARGTSPREPSDGMFPRTSWNNKVVLMFF